MWVVSIPFYQPSLHHEMDVITYLLFGVAIEGKAGRAQTRSVVLRS